jgi:ribokinase
VKPLMTVVGSLNIDIVVKCGTRPKPGETIMGQYHNFIPGGKGGNQACAIAKLGGRVTMIGCLGTDPLGSIVLESLEDSGVDTSALHVIEGVQTGAAFITVDGRGENSIILTSGANGKLDQPRIAELHEVIAKSDVTLAQLEVPFPAVERAAEIALSANRRFVLNPTPVRDLPPDSVLWRSTVFVVNEHEAEFYSGIRVEGRDHALSAARIINEKGVETVVVTLGEAGSVALAGRREIVSDAMAVEVVDTTAAGDTYIGGFCTEWLRTERVDDAMAYASAAAAISVSRFGAQTSIPSEQEVFSFLRAAAGEHAH